MKYCSLIAAILSRFFCLHSVVVRLRERLSMYHLSRQLLVYNSPFHHWTPRKTRNDYRVSC